MKEHEMISNEQWKSVKVRTDKLRDALLILGQIPGTNSLFLIKTVIDPLLRKYDCGERTQSLYDEMMALK